MTPPIPAACAPAAVTPATPPRALLQVTHEHPDPARAKAARAALGNLDGYMRQLAGGDPAQGQEQAR